MANKRVKINADFELVYDSLCMWIEKKTERKDKKNESPIFKRVSGYHRTISELMQSFEGQRFRDIDGVETLQELAATQLKMHDEIRAMCRDLETRLK